MMLTRLVSLNRATKSLVMGGRITRIAWGRMMRRKVSSRDMPSEAAASHWPRGIERIPAR